MSGPSRSPDSSGSPRSRVASLHVYPVKGCRAIDLPRADVLPVGLRHDRRFMVLGQDGTFVTQRSHAALALVETAIEGGALVLRASGSQLEIDVAALQHDRGPRRRAIVWKAEVECVDAGADAAAFFSDHLKEKCTLVFMPDDVIRPVDRPYAKPGDRVGFADGFPLLVASLASLADLNGRLEQPVPMNRFRPNVVVEGGLAWDEERHAAMRVGGASLRLAERCARCDVTLVDQRTGSRGAGVNGKEPLRTLATYRAEGNSVYFAMNAIPDLGPDASVTIAVGDPVELSAPL
jgi:hypothetical protein